MSVTIMSIEFLIFIWVNPHKDVIFWEAGWVSNDFTRKAAFHNWQ